MPRPSKTDRPVEKRINLPESLVAQVELKLFSDVEGRVPYGAWAAYVQRLIEEDLTRKEASAA